MKIQHQTRLSDKEKGVYGNCLITSYACYFDLEVEDCPQVQLLFDTKIPEVFWNDVIEAFLKRMGYKEVHWLPEYDPCNEGCNDYYFAWGQSPRGLSHQVIYKDGKLFHDPHPSGAGLTEIRGYITLEKL